MLKDLVGKIDNMLEKMKSFQLRGGKYFLKVKWKY